MVDVNGWRKSDVCLFRKRPQPSRMQVRDQEARPVAGATQVCDSARSPHRAVGCSQRFTSLFNGPLGSGWGGTKGGVSGTPRRPFGAQSGIDRATFSGRCSPSQACDGYFAAAPPCLLCTKCRAMCTTWRLRLETVGCRGVNEDCVFDGVRCPQLKRAVSRLRPRDDVGLAAPSFPAPPTADADSCLGCSPERGRPPLGHFAGAVPPWGGRPKHPHELSHTGLPHASSICLLSFVSMLAQGGWPSLCQRARVHCPYAPTLRPHFVSRRTSLAHRRARSLRLSAGLAPLWPRLWPRTTAVRPRRRAGTSRDGRPGPRERPQWRGGAPSTQSVDTHTHTVEIAQAMSTLAHA